MKKIELHLNLTIYRVIQVERPIAMHYSWDQEGCRKEGRVLLYPVFAPIFCVKFQCCSFNGLEMAISRS
jgi:hypothetical protein